jgi:hypothetical protein
VYCFLRSAALRPPEGRQILNRYFEERRKVKTYRNLYPQVWDFENLYLAYRKARRGKRGRVPAAEFERIQDDELLALQDELHQRTYHPGQR